MAVDCGTAAGYLSWALAGPGGGRPITILLKAYAGSASPAAVRYMVEWYGNSSNHIRVWQAAGAATLSLWGDEGGTNCNLTSVGFSAGQWVSIGIDQVAADDRALWVDASENPESTTAAGDPVPVYANIYLGARNDGSGAFEGYLAELACYSVELTAAEHNAYHKGFSPLFIRPASLLFYAPCIRDWTDIVGGLTGSENGTVNVAPHPAMIYPTRPKYALAVSGGGGGSVLTHTLSAGTWRTFTALADGASSAFRRDGTADTGDAGSGASSGITVGAKNDGTGKAGVVVGRMIRAEGDQSANQAAIEAYLDAYYGRY